jgi:CO dehydrogenase maturation factor
MKLASEMGIKKSYIIVNKVREENDLAFVKNFLSNENKLSIIPYSEDIIKSDRADNGIHIEDTKPIDTIRNILIKEVMNG